MRTSQESCPRLGGQGGCDGGVCVTCGLCIRARALGLQKGRQAFRRVAARPARPASGRVGTLVRFPLRWALLLVFSRDPRTALLSLSPPGPAAPAGHLAGHPAGHPARHPAPPQRLQGCGPGAWEGTQPSSFLTLVGPVWQGFGGTQNDETSTHLLCGGTETHPISETGKNLVFKKWLPDRARLSQAWGGLGGHLLPAALLLRPIEVALASACSCDQGLHGGFLPWDLGFALSR